jgi:hypothetical protein
MTEYANSESTVDDHTEVRCRQIAVFFNEYGNLIHIEVSGVADNQLRIVVRGPSSESENIVTRAEAERLRLVLNDFLGPSKMKTTHDQWCDLRHDGYECNCAHGEPL